MCLRLLDDSTHNVRGTTSACQATAECDAMIDLVTQHYSNILLRMAECRLDFSHRLISPMLMHNLTNESNRGSSFTYRWL